MKGSLGFRETTAFLVKINPIPDCYFLVQVISLFNSNKLSMVIYIMNIYKDSYYIPSLHTIMDLHRIIVI